MNYRFVEELIQEGEYIRTAPFGQEDTADYNNVFEELERTVRAIHADIGQIGTGLHLTDGEINNHSWAELVGHWKQRRRITINRQSGVFVPTRADIAINDCYSTTPHCRATITGVWYNIRRLPEATIYTTELDVEKIRVINGKSNHS